MVRFCKRASTRKLVSPLQNDAALVVRWIDLVHDQTSPLSSHDAGDETANTDAMCVISAPQVVASSLFISLESLMWEG